MVWSLRDNPDNLATHQRHPISTNTAYVVATLFLQRKIACLRLSHQNLCNKVFGPKEGTYDARCDFHPIRFSSSLQVIMILLNLNSLIFTIPFSFCDTINSEK